MLKKYRPIDEFDPSTGHPKRWAILSVMCISLVVIVLDNSILNVAIPSISNTLGATDKDILWIIDIYTLVFAGLLLTAGTLGDKYGRRLLLQIGLTIFGIASIVAAVAQSPEQLIVGRGLMGIGGAAIMPSTLSIITNIFPASERGRAIGIWAGFAGVGAAIGPLTGGFLLEHFWWGSVFIVNIPIVFFGVFANLVLVPESKDKHASKIDIPGAVLSIIALSSLLYAIIIGADTSFTNNDVIASFVIALVSITIFFIWETKTKTPMIQLSFFKDRRFATGALAITLTFFAMFSMGLLLTQYLQIVLGYSPLQSGAGLVPFALTMFITAPTSARIASKIGTKTTVALGLSFVTIGLFSISTLEVNDTYLDALWMFIVTAIGMGLTMAPSTAAIMNSLPRQKAGVGSAMNDTTRMVGGALGLAVIGSISSAIYSARMKSNENLIALKDYFLSNGVNENQVKNVFSDITNSLSRAIGNSKAFLDPSIIEDETIRSQIEIVPAPIRQEIAVTISDAAKESFVDGLSLGMKTACISTLLAIVAVVIFMPQNAMSQGQETGIEH